MAWTFHEHADADALATACASAIDAAIVLESATVVASTVPSTRLTIPVTPGIVAAVMPPSYDSASTSDTDHEVALKSRSKITVSEQAMSRMTAIPATASSARRKTGSGESG